MPSCGPSRQRGILKRSPLETAGFSGLGKARCWNQACTRSASPRSRARLSALLFSSASALKAWDVLGDHLDLKGNISGPSTARDWTQPCKWLRDGRPSHTPAPWMAVLFSVQWHARGCWDGHRVYLFTRTPPIAHALSELVKRTIPEPWRWQGAVGSHSVPALPGAGSGLSKAAQTNPVSDLEAKLVTLTQPRHRPHLCPCPWIQGG